MTTPTNTPLEALHELSKAARRLAEVAQDMRAAAMRSALEDPNVAVMKQSPERLNKAAREVTDALCAVQDKFG